MLLHGDINLKLPYLGQKWLWTMWLCLVLSICFYVLELKTAILTGRTFTNGSSLDQAITQEFGTGAVGNLVFLSYGAVGVGFVAVMIYSFSMVLSLLNRGVNSVSVHAPRQFSSAFYKAHTLGLIAIVAMMILSFGGTHFLPASLYPFTNQSYMDVMFILFVGLSCGVLGLNQTKKLHRSSMRYNHRRY